MKNYTETTPIQDREDRTLLVNPAEDYNGDDYDGGYIVIEGFWDEMAGNYWGLATGAPTLFKTEKEAQDWINIQKGRD